jgi:hypothetical protein
MAKYDNVNENIGQIFVEELFADIKNETITGDELFKKKLINKFCECYDFALTESLSELQETMDAINSLKQKKQIN